LVATIELPKGTVAGQAHLAVGPGPSPRLYAVNAGWLSLISGSTVTSIAIEGQEARDLEVAPQTGLAYVALDRQLWILDGPDVLAVEEASAVRDVAPVGGGLVWVGADGWVALYDRSRRLTTRSMSQGAIVGVAPDPVRGRVFVAWDTTGAQTPGRLDSWLPDLSLLDGFVFLPDKPSALALDPLTDLVHVAEGPAGVVRTFSKRRVQDSLLYSSELYYQRVGRLPSQLAADPLTGWLYVLNTRDASVSVLEGAHQLGAIAVGGSPSQLRLDLESGLLVVPDPAGDSVSVIEAGARSHVVSVGDEPVAAAIDGAGRRVYVLNRQSNTISVIDVPVLAED
jgi:DNA-binding beta-propeller fold protein YncE